MQIITQIMCGAMLCALPACQTVISEEPPSAEVQPELESMICGGFSNVDIENMDEDTEEAMVHCIGMVLGRISKDAPSNSNWELVSARRQVVAGLNYIVVMKNDTTPVKTATATIWQKLDGTFQMTAFELK